MDHLEVERARPRTCSPGLHVVHRHVLQLVLLDLRARHRDRQRAAVDRRAGLPARAAPTAARRRGPRGRASARSRRCGRRCRAGTRSRAARGRSPSISGVGNIRPVSITTIRPVVLDAPSCSCRSRRDRRAAGPAGWRPAQSLARDRRPQRVEHPAQLRQLGLVDLDQRQPHAAELEAERLERGLDRRGRRRDEERAVEVLELGVERPRALRVAGTVRPRTSPSCARPPGARTRVMPPAPADLGERAAAGCRRRRTGRGPSPRRSAAPASMSAFACFTPTMLSIRRQLDRAGRARG